jgi:hypothetical protein
LLVAIFIKHLGDVCGRIPACSSLQIAQGVIGFGVGAANWRPLFGATTAVFVRVVIVVFG